MPIKVKVDYPNLASGLVVFIHGLGEVKNGHTAEFSDEQVEQFRAQRRNWHDDKPGPTLAQAFKDNDFVTVESAKEGGR